MKTYILFMYDNYYPGGGSNDIVGQFSSIEEAISACALMKQMDNAEIYDVNSGIVVATKSLYRKWILKTS